MSNLLMASVFGGKMNTKYIEKQIQNNSDLFIKAINELKENERPIYFSNDRGNISIAKHISSMNTSFKLKGIKNNMYDDILKMLNENNDIETQKKGLELADKIDDIGTFFSCEFPNTLWKNFAKIIERKNDEQLKQYVGNMLEWIQDINRSGAFRIYFRLKDMNVDSLYNEYIKTVSFAAEENDDVWLDYLSGLTENKILNDKLPIAMKKLLKKHSKNFWKGNSESFRIWMEDNDL